MTVIDASVAVKWFLPEAGDEAAQQLLADGDELLAPALIQVEVAAAIARKARLKEIGKRDAQAAAELWFRSLANAVVNLVPDETDLPAAVKLSLALEHPVQDCLYLALAARLRAPIITADHQFVAQAGGSHPQVRRLGKR